MSFKNIVIKSEEDIYKHIAAYVKNNEALKDVNLSFEHEATLKIRIHGDKFDGSMTPTVMRAFIEIQRGIYRSYAIAKYGTPEVRRLNDRERADLEMSVRIEKGSSVFEAEMSKIFLQLSDKIINKMPPEYILAIVFFSILTYAGGSVARTFIVKRAETKQYKEGQITQRVLSAEETKRHEIMASLVRKHPVLENIQNSAHDANIAVLKSIASGSGGEIQGVKVDAHEAAILSANERRMSQEIRLDNNYRIMAVNARDASVFKVTLQVLDTNAEFVAEARDMELSLDDKAKLQNAEWGHTVIWLSINAKTFNLGKTNEYIQGAKILKVGKEG